MTADELRAAEIEAMTRAIESVSLFDYALTPEEASLLATAAYEAATKARESAAHDLIDGVWD